MGYNTTVVILNDALGDIEDDQDFGRKLAQACKEVFTSRGEPINVSSGGHTGAAKVIETHHADRTVLIKVGGNMGIVERGDSNGR